MKAQEAIFRIKVHNEVHQRTEHLAVKITEALNLAITALEKQVPSPLDYEGDGYADGHLVYDVAYCPECRHSFEEGVNDWGSNFCPNCGQALDWNASNE